MARRVYALCAARFGASAGLGLAATLPTGVRNRSRSASRRRTRPPKTLPPALFQSRIAFAAPALSPALNLRSADDLANAPGPML